MSRRLRVRVDARVVQRCRYRQVGGRVCGEPLVLMVAKSLHLAGSHCVSDMPEGVIGTGRCPRCGSIYATRPLAGLLGPPVSDAEISSLRRGADG